MMGVWERGYEIKGPVPLRFSIFSNILVSMISNPGGRVKLLGYLGPPSLKNRIMVFQSIFGANEVVSIFSLVLEPPVVVSTALITVSKT